MKFLNQLKKVTLLKAIFILSTTVALSLSTSSCKDNDDRYIEPELVINTQLEGDAITFDRDGGAWELSITTNRKWTINTSADWLSITPTSGEAGSVKVTIKALANTSFARTGSITIISGVTKKSITVKQDGEGGSAEVVIFNEDFNSGLGCWTTKLISAGANNWKTGEYKGDGYVGISAFKTSADENKALLISPMVDFKTTTVLSFQYKPHHAVPGTKLKVVLLNKDQEIIGDPIETIDPSEPTEGFAKQYTDLTVGIPLNADAKYIALYYDADKTHTTGFQIDNIKLLGGEGSVPVDCGGTTPDPTPGDAISSFSVDFEDNKLPEGWSTTSLEGKRKWEVREFGGNHYAQMSSHKTNDNDKVLLSTPLLDLSKATTLKFKSKVRFAKAGTIFKVVLLDADKKELSVLKTYDLDKEHEFELQTIDVPANTNAKYIGFLYEGDPTHTSTIQLDDIVLGDGNGGTNPTPDPDPDPTPGDMTVVIFDNSFSETMGCWTNKKEINTGAEWKLDKYIDKKTKEVKDSYIKISAYDYASKVGIPTKSLLVSPMIDFKTATSLSFKYKQYYAKEGTTLKVVLLDASKAIIGDALMTVNPSEPIKGYAKDYTAVSVGIELNKKAKYVALYYEGDETHTTGFQIKDVRLMGETGAIPVDCNGGTNPTPDPDPDPTPSDAISSFSADFEAPKLPKGWETKALEGDKDWKIKDYKGNYFVQMSSYQTKTTDKVLLTTPLLDLRKASTLTFKKKVRYPVDGTILKVQLLGSDKNVISELKSYNLDTQNDDFVVETIEISANKNAKYIGFLYEGDPKHTSMIQLDDIELAPKGSTNPTPDPTPAPGGGDEIFFNVYAEGSGSNKYLSIYNPSDKAVDLSDYTIKLNQFNSKNGFHKDIEENLSGTIPAKGVIVYKKDNADYTGEATALSGNLMNFNGNDNVALFKGDKMIDVIGKWGEAWISDDSPKGVGADVTLHRKASINKPSTTFDMNQWDSYPKDSTEPFGKR